MAFDMHGQISTFSPASVAAFLRETVTALPTIDQEAEGPDPWNWSRRLAMPTCFPELRIRSRKARQRLGGARLDSRRDRPYGRRATESTSAGSGTASGSSRTRRSRWRIGRFGFSESFRRLGPLRKPPLRNAGLPGSGHRGIRHHGGMCPGDMLLVRRRRMQSGLP